MLFHSNFYNGQNWVECLSEHCGYIVVLQCVGNLVTRLLQPCNKVVTISNPRFLPGCHKLVTRLSQPGDKVGTTIYYNLVTTLLQPCNKVVTILNPRFLPGCHNLVTRLSQPSTTTLLTLGAHAHSEGYSSCRVCMCVCVYVCVYVCMCMCMCMCV